MTETQTLKSILKQIDDRTELLANVKVALSVAFGYTERPAAPQAPRQTTRARASRKTTRPGNTRQVLYAALTPGVFLTSADIFKQIPASDWTTPERSRKQSLAVLLSHETRMGRLVKSGNRWGLPEAPVAETLDTATA